MWTRGIDEAWIRFCWDDKVVWQLNKRIHSNLLRTGIIGSPYHILYEAEFLVRGHTLTAQVFYELSIQQILFI